MDKEFIRSIPALFRVGEGVSQGGQRVRLSSPRLVYCPKEGREDEKKYRKDIRAALQGQIEFIRYHVSLMAIEPSERGTLHYIGRFLSMQHLLDQYFPNGKGLLSPQLSGRESRLCEVYVEELSDIDLKIASLPLF